MERCLADAGSAKGEAAAKSEARNPKQIQMLTRLSLAENAKYGLRNEGPGGRVDKEYEALSHAGRGDERGKHSWC
jgi:hypothetical protein